MLNQKKKKCRKNKRKVEKMQLEKAVGKSPEVMTEQRIEDNVGVNHKRPLPQKNREGR